jgi:hypothetical protein
MNQLMLFRGGGGKSLFIAKTIRNIKVHSLDRMQSFRTLKQVVHIGPLGFKRLMLCLKRRQPTNNTNNDLKFVSNF